MKQLKTTAGLASLLSVLVVILQWFVTNAEAFAALLLSLGVPPEWVGSIQTIIALVLTLLGAFGVYQVKARGVWAR